MKRLFLNLLICFSLTGIYSCSDDAAKNDKDDISSSDIPANVQSAFSAKYSTATDVKWEDAHEDTVQTYKAKFMINGKKMKAEFDRNGGFVKEEEDN